MPHKDVEELRDTIRHEFSYVSRYIENTGGPTLKIHLARLRAALEPAPVDETEPSTSDVPGLYRPSRLDVTDYVVESQLGNSAALLNRAASIMNELAHRGVFSGHIAGGTDMVDEVARWFRDYERLARS